MFAAYAMWGLYIQSHPPIISRLLSSKNVGLHGRIHAKHEHRHDLDQRNVQL